MATRYTLVMTFGGEEGETWENWQEAALESVSEQVNHHSFTSGEVSLAYEDQVYRVFWTLDPEDE